MTTPNPVKLEIERSEYKGSPTLTIWEILSNGQRSQYPLLSFGKKKAKAIIECKEAIEEFARSEK
jgi:hypothetical protein